MKLELNLALKNLLGARLRTLLNVLVLSFSFVIIIFLNSIMDGWDQQAQKDSIEWEFGNGHLINEKFDPLDPYTILDGHGKIPEENVGLTAILDRQASIYPQGRMISIVLKGISSKQEILKLPTKILKESKEEFPVIIGKRLAESAKLNKGDRVQVRWRDSKGTYDANTLSITSLIETISSPNEDVKAHAPKMITRRIPNEYIGALIGPGGKVIQELQKESGCTIVVNEDPVTEEGIIEILGTSPEGIIMVEAKIDSITFKPKVGNTYEVKVIKMLDFGAVVEYTEAPGNEVLLHVSELAWERTENVSDIVNMGDVLDVKYFGKDPRTRKEKVSRKALIPRPDKKD